MLIRRLVYRSPDAATRPPARAAAGVDRVTTPAAAQVIVVDGGSPEHHDRVLPRARHSLGDRTEDIREEKRGGFVRAGSIKVSSRRQGAQRAWLNDDARPCPNRSKAVAPDRSCEDCVGSRSWRCFHRWTQQRTSVRTFTNGNLYRLVATVRGTLYATFTVGRRETFESWVIRERYYFFAPIPICRQGVARGIEGCPGVRRRRWITSRGKTPRAADDPYGETDNAGLFEKVGSAEKNLRFFNDFHPVSAEHVRVAATGAEPA